MNFANFWQNIKSCLTNGTFGIKPSPFYKTPLGFGVLFGSVPQGSRYAALRGNPGLSYKIPSG
jgi:hypothetical protein